MVGGGDGSPDCDLVTHAAAGAAVRASIVTAFIDWQKVSKGEQSLVSFLSTILLRSCKSAVLPWPLFHIPCPPHISLGYTKLHDVTDVTAPESAAAGEPPAGARLG